MFSLINIKNNKVLTNKEKFIQNPNEFILKNRFYIKYPSIVPLFPLHKNIFKLNNKVFDVNEIYNDILKAQTEINWISKGNNKIWESITIKSKNGLQQPFLEEIDFNSDFQYTEIGNKCNIIKNLLENLNTEIYLVRILKLSPYSKVGWHTDEVVFKYTNKVIRCHIPIRTNFGAKMLIGHPLQEPKNNIWQAETLFEEHLQEGYLYYTNVNALHSVYNSGNTDRIHLVIDLKPTNEILDLILK